MIILVLNNSYTIQYKYCLWCITGWFLCWRV